MPAEFLYNLTKNLSAHLQHKSCAVLPKKKLLHRHSNVKQFLFDLSPDHKVSGSAADESAMV